MNTTAASAIAEAVRTTLGPNGMDKMLVDSTGEVLISNDGATILSELTVEQPAGMLIVDVAETVEAEVGDGTTSSVVLAGRLLEEASTLHEEGIHPTAIAAGYRQAADRAIEELDTIAHTIESDDTALLERIAATAMTGKGAEGAKDHLGSLVVGAVQAVTLGDRVETDHIVIHPIPDGAIDRSTLIDGIVVDDEPGHTNMPRRLADASVAVFDGPIEVGESEIEADVRVRDPDHLMSFLEEEQEQIRELVAHFEAIGVDAVFCGRTIDDVALQLFGDADILALERLDDAVVSNIARATDAKIVSDVAELTEADLGFAGSVEQRHIGDEDRVVIEDVADAQSVSILLRGGTEHVVAEVERAVTDAIGVVEATIEDGRYIPGGGAGAVAMGLALRDHAESVPGREQFAIEAFADALEVIPATLAENAGMHPIDALVELRHRHSEGIDVAGVNAHDGTIEEVTDGGVVEPLALSRQAIQSATDAAITLLRIDDVISVGDLEKEERGASENEFEGVI